MEKPRENPPPLPERVLIQLGIPDSGWVNDRPTISDQTAREIEERLADKMTRAEVNDLMPILRRGFSSAVEMAQVHDRLQKEIEVQASVTGRKKRPPKKLGVILRDYIRGLRSVLSEAEHGKRRIRWPDFLRDIEQIEVLDRLVTSALEEKLSFGITDPLRTSPERAADLMAEVLEDVEYSIDAGIRTGPSEPALNHLALVFVHAYRAVTGHNPGRTWNDYSETETGFGLEVCRVLAGELYRLLLEAEARAKPADMTKPYRNAIQSLKDQGEPQA
ncbi:hypothetical protein [Aestuariivita boseongensis]|uniref:hypothetical protein n=1 Tax=Aestuariivita boseongensis TaxID=1470562 RepID=UPI0012F80C65|nr:hypothetical protein [Aestuariivita boseongensis]